MIISLNKKEVESLYNFLSNTDYSSIKHMLKNDFTESEIININEVFDKLHDKISMEIE